MAHRAAQELFDEALSLPVAERSDFLKKACNGNTALLKEVEKLLGDYEQAHDFFSDFGAQIVRGTAEAALDDSMHPGPSFSHYECFEMLGAGGMGVVYRARESKLNRIVAVKLLRKDLASDRIARARFIQEARAASAIDHPNVCTIHEVGQTNDGQIFIAMAWYQGQTLQKLLKTGRVATERVVALGTQIAEGLQAAHSRGVIHRDIKPSNLLITEGRSGTTDGLLKILDFGLAKVAGLELTRAVGALGTVAYMSPEQTRGETVDHRSDIWSAGVVLYEMLTGERPFRAESEQALLYAIRHDAPEPLRKLRTDAPAALARIVDRCLAKDPARRYLDAAALRDDLATATAAPLRPHGRRFGPFVAVPCIILLILLAALQVWPGRQAAAYKVAREVASSVAVPRIAVLPLRNGSIDKEDVFLSDTLGDELISLLSRFDGLHVIGRRSTRQYRDTTKTPDQIGRELKAQALVQGEVLKLRGKIELRLRLIDAASRRETWSNQYEAVPGDLSLLPHKIASDLAAALRVDVEYNQRRHRQRQDVVPDEAYTAYLEAQYFIRKRDRQSLWDARDRFQQAIDLAPTFSEAWAGLANAYLLLGSYSWVPVTEAGSRARSAAQQALKLNSDLPEAHIALATVLQQYDWDRQRAGEHCRRAIELNPGFATAHQWYSEHLWSLRRFEEAIVEARRARELDPLALPAQLSVGIALYMAGRFDEAISDYQQLLAVDPNNTLTNFYLGLAYARQKQYEQAIAQFQKVEPRWGYGPDAAASLGGVYAEIGRTDEARKMLSVLEQLSKKQQVTPFHSAVILYRLGEKERAFELLNRGADMRIWYVQLLNVEHGFEPMRSDPRFAALLKRTGF